MTTPESQNAPPRDWDDAYANMAHIPGSDALPQIWIDTAAAYRASGVTVTEHAYGDHSRERFDLVMPQGTPKGLAVFVHGGYWMRLDKSMWTDLAEGARAKGWAVCLPSYTLAPDAPISHMTQQIGAAITTAAKMIAGPIRLSGHSAGGHLASRMICDDTPLDHSITARIDHTLSISGVHDLRPLLKTKLNETLGLDVTSATSESPALRMPNGAPHITAWVGGGERPEFIRQTRILPQIWGGLGAHTNSTVDGDHDHFTVIEGLRDPDSPITYAFVGD